MSSAMSENSSFLFRRFLSVDREGRRKAPRNAVLTGTMGEWQKSYKGLEGEQIAFNVGK